MRCCDRVFVPLCPNGLQVMRASGSVWVESGDAGRYASLVSRADEKGTAL